MRYIPLLAIPFLLYNAFAFLIFAGNAGEFAAATMFRNVPMVSGATFSLSVGATIVLMALLLLAVEVVKATRIGASSVVDHVLATVLFVIFLLEFLLVPQAATDTFLVLMAIALVDLVCGFAVSLRSAARDVTFTG
jgi:hypothetical protein